MLTRRRGDELALGDTIVRRGTRYVIVTPPLVDQATAFVTFTVRGPAGDHPIRVTRGDELEVDVELGPRRADALARNLIVERAGVRWRIVHTGPAKRGGRDLLLECVSSPPGGPVRGGRKYVHRDDGDLVTVVELGPSKAGPA